MERNRTSLNAETFLSNKLANNLLADTSWYSVQWILSTLSQCNQLRECTSPTTGRQWHPTCLSGERRAGGERSSFPLAHAGGKQQFGTNYIHLDPGNKQFPKSVTATPKLSRLLLGKEIQVSLRLIPQDWHSTGAVVLSAPGSPAGCVAVWWGCSGHA